MNDTVWQQQEREKNLNCMIQMFMKNCYAYVCRKSEFMSLAVKFNNFTVATKEYS